MPMKNRLKALEKQASSRSGSAAGSRSRTPNPDGEENGQLDFNFASLEEMLTSKLENLEGWREKNYDFKQETVDELNKAKITSSSSINELIKSLTVGRTEVSSESRELILAQLYKLIVVKSILVYNEEREGTKDYVGEENVQDLAFIFLKNDFRSSQEFLLLYRCLISLISSDLDEYGSLVDTELINHIRFLINEPSNAIITNENKSHLITGYVGLLLILNNDTAGYGIDDIIKWLLDLTDGYCSSALTTMRDFKEGNREYSTFFDELSDQRIVNEISSKQMGETLVGISGLHGVGCLLTLLPRNQFLNDIIEDMMPKLIEFLDNDLNIELSKASGRVIALCYEIYHYNNDDDDEFNDDDNEYNYNSPYYEQEQLLSILDRLASLNDKKISKKDKKQVHSIFRDIYNTVNNYGTFSIRIEILKRSAEGVEILSTMMDSNYIKLSRSRTIQINSWFLYLRLIHLKWVFSFGVHNQLIVNSLIRDILKEPPNEYQLKYNVAVTNDSDEDDDSRFNNQLFEVSDKKRSNMLRKARINKLSEEMEDMSLK